MPSAMRISLNKIGALLLAALLATTVLPGGAHAAAKGRKEKKKSEAPAPKKLSAYEKLFKDKESRTAEGLFQTPHHRPESSTRKSRSTSSNASSSSTPRSRSRRWPTTAWRASNRCPPYHVTFSRRDSVVRMHEVPRRTLSDGDAGIVRALEISSAMPIVASYPIKAYNADSTAVVIENTALFMSDNEHLKAFEARGMSPLHISRAQLQGRPLAAPRRGGRKGLRLGHQRHDLRRDDAVFHLHHLQRQAFHGPRTTHGHDAPRGVRPGAHRRPADRACCPCPSPVSPRNRARVRPISPRGSTSAPEVRFVP